LRIGGRQSNAQYQYTIQSENLNELVKWGPIVLAEIRKLHGFTDVNSDQQNAGLQASLTYDRQTAARLGISAQLLDDTLYDAFGQRQVSTIFTSLNQYHVVMEVDPQFWQNPKGLDVIYLRPTNGSNVVPSSASAGSQPTPEPMAAATPASTGANSQPAPGPMAATTPSSAGASSQPAPAPMAAATPSSAAASSQPTPAPMAAATPSRAGASSQPTPAPMAAGTPSRAGASSQPTPAPMVAATPSRAGASLYESYIHPVTILSTLPSAGVGALLTLMLFRTEISVITIIGLLLLIGIVKKNAILMVDFALEAERAEGMQPGEAIYKRVCCVFARS
jgi:multidrug efflux pump